MATLTIPNIFTNNVSTVDAVTTNANNSAIQAAVNNIDHFNIGAAGLYASNLLPTTVPQATFGATATGVGYKFLANDATATPLTVSGVAGQSVDIFDVTLTSGGTKALFVSSAGITNLTAAVNPLVINQGANQEALKFVSSASSGFTALGATTGASTIGILGSVMAIDNAGTAQLFAFDTLGNFAALNSLFGKNLIVTALSAVSASGIATAGDATFQRSANTGAIILGGATGNVAIDYNVNNLAAVSVKNAGGYIDVFGGTYHNVSDESLKTNINAIAGALSKIAALTPVTFDWADTGRSSAGFTAQDVKAQFPDAVIADSNGTLLYAPSVVLAHLVQAFQDYVASHP